MNTVLEAYKPLRGFYDLRNWDIPIRDFKKFVATQKYLFQCEQDRINGKYMNMPLELNKIKNLSAEYQNALFTYKYNGKYE